MARSTPGRHPTGFRRGSHRCLRRRCMRGVSAAKRRASCAAMIPDAQGDQPYQSAATRIARHLQVPQDPQGRGQDLRVFLPARRREERAGRHLQAAHLAQGADREPAAPRGRPQRQGRRHPRRGRVAEGQDLHARDRLSPGPRADAGLHRRAGRGRPRRHARRHEGAGRRSLQDQPAGAGRPRHRPFRSGRLLRLGRRLQEERRDRVRAQQGALRVPALGRRAPSTTSASCRRAPASAIRSTSSICRSRCGPSRPAGSSRRSPTPASAPTATPPWSTRWACSPGAWAASRRRPPCSASRSPW